MWAKLFHTKRYMKIYNAYLRNAGFDMRGNAKYIHRSVHLDIGYASHIHMGEGLVISVNSVILAHDFSLECGLTAVGRQNKGREQAFVKDVFIGDNVFIGAGCVILPGTEIGADCIIGAGTVCSGRIPPRSVVTGQKFRTVKSIDDWTAEKLGTETDIK